MVIFRDENDFHTDKFRNQCNARITAIDREKPFIGHSMVPPKAMLFGCNGGDGAACSPIWMKGTTKCKHIPPYPLLMPRMGEANTASADTLSMLFSLTGGTSWGRRDPGRRGPGSRGSVQPTLTTWTIWTSAYGAKSKRRHGMSALVVPML